MNTGLLVTAAAAVILIRGAMTRTDAYGAYLRGAESGLRSTVQLLPALCAMLLMLKLLQASGITQIAARLLTPLTDALGIPGELTPLLLLRPLTGSGSIAAMEEVFRQCGPDSRAGRMASILMGSSETIFYTMTVYSGAAGVRSVPGALAASLIGYASSVVLCSLIVR